MKIYTLVIGDLETNCYIVADENTKKAVVIDPAENGADIYDAVKEYGYTLENILLTHGHYDHIGGLDTLRELSGAKVIAHKNNPIVATDFTVNMSYEAKGEIIKAKKADILVDEGDSFSVGNMVFEVLYTPGHTIDSIIYICGDAAFTGDTIFAEGYGRTDFVGGNMGDMRNTLRRILPLLKGKTVYPGHWQSRKF